MRAASRGHLISLETCTKISKVGGGEGKGEDIRINRMKTESGKD